MVEIKSLSLGRISLEYRFMDTLFASNNLLGLDINGWVVIEKLPKPDIRKHETGGNFSVCYLVEKGKKTAFMKVLDLEKIYTRPLPPGVSRPMILERSSAEFNYEKELSDYCSGKHLSNVVYYIESGNIVVDGYMFGDVSYIIYEKADGDIKKVIDFSRSIEFAAKLKSVAAKIKSLHSVAVGLEQLHSNGISHQDLKPSNILSFSGESKIGDLGRSLCLNGEVACPYGASSFNGDWTYAAPECFFKSATPITDESLYQMDNYMLGNLICYYITGLSLNAIVNYYLPDDLKMRPLVVTPIDYTTVLPDIINAYQKALIDVANEIPMPEIRKDLMLIVQYLSNPDPTKRGEPKTVRQAGANYNLKRTVTQLDVLYGKAKIALLRY